MQDLIEHLKEKVGLTEEQAAGTLHAIKEFISAKVPMLGGMLDGLLGNHAQAAETTDVTTGATSGGDMLGGLMGSLGKSGEGIGDMLGGIFGGNDKAEEAKS